MAVRAIAVPGQAPAGWLGSTTLRHPTLVQLVRYALVGGLGTAANAAVFLVARTWWDAVPANLVALILSTALSTEVNRRFTFGGVMGHRWRARVQNGGTVFFYAVYSSTVLFVLSVFVDGPTPLVEALAVAAASVLGGLGRFLVLRYWVFGLAEKDAPVAAHPADRTGATWIHRHGHPGPG